MKNFFRFLLMSLFLATSFSVASCSDDDDPAGGNSIVGAWEQVDEDGTITVRFNSNKTGVIDYVSADGSGSVKENFEYDYQPEERYLEIIGSELDGEYEVTLTATKIRLKNYYDGEYYELTRK